MVGVQLDRDPSLEGMTDLSSCVHLRLDLGVAWVGVMSACTCWRVLSEGNRELCCSCPSRRPTVRTAGAKPVGSCHEM